MHAIGGGLVLGASKWGLVVWKLSHMKIHSLKAFESRAASEADAWFFVPIVNLSEWKVAQVICMSPVQIAAQLGFTSVVDQVALTKGPAEDIVSAAAKHGFSQLTTPLLDKLMKVFKLTFAPGNRPTKEFDMVKALVEYALPEASPEEVAACLVARRRMFQEDAYAMLAHPGNLEKLEGAVDDDDYELIKKATEVASKAKAKWAAADQAARLAAPAAAASSAGSSGSTLPWSARPFPVEDDWIVETARAFVSLGAKPRAVLTKDTSDFPSGRQCTLAAPPLVQ